MAKVPKPPVEGGWLPEDRAPAFSRSATHRAGPPPQSIYDVAELSDARAQYWLAMDGWSDKEAAMLLCAVDPAAVETLGGFDHSSLRFAWPLHADDLQHLIVRAGEVGALAFPAPPRDVLQWAHRKNLRMPARFVSWLRGAPPEHSERSQAVPREMVNQDAILHWLEREGLDAQALPRASRGLPDPIKQRAKRDLAAQRPPVTPSAFDKAWKTLRRDGRLKDA